MKNKIVIVLAILLCLLAFVSCELGFPVDKPDIYMISVGCDFGSKGNTVTINKGYNAIGLPYGAFVKFGHLNYTINDAVEVGKAFESLAKKAGYKFNIQYLLGPDKNNSDNNYPNDELGKYVVGNPTYENFKTALSNLPIRDKDILICYFSTHGGSATYDLPDPTKPGGYSATITDDSLGFYDCIVAYECLKKRIDSEKGTKIIICDSCYSGSFITSENGVTINPELSVKNPIKILFNSKIKESATVYTLTASTYKQTSHEENGSEKYLHGVFTRQLLNALGWKDSSKTLGNIAALKNNKLTLSNIAKYIYEKTEDSRNSQASTFYGGLDDVVLFKF